MHIISLVGEQPMPILIPLWQRKQQSGFKDSLQFVATKTTLHIAHRLIDFISNDPSLKHHFKVSEKKPIILVDAYQLIDTQDKLIEEVKNNQNQRVLINLTSGTKIVSLACLQSAQGRDVELVYVSTQTNELLFFHPTSKRETRQTIDVTISVKQYFAAHGFETNPNLNFSNPFPPVAPPKAGDELEELVYSSLKDSGLFDDVQKSLYIRRSMGKEDAVINEFDVLATYNGNLAVCSCKSGRVDKQNKYLYELSALTSRDLAGIYCQRLLISAQPDENISDDIKNRAKADRIKIVSQERLPDVAQVIYNSLK